MKDQKSYFIQIPSEVLQRTDLHPYLKLICGYIHTRLNITEVEWTISKADVEKQCGIPHTTAHRHLTSLVKEGILSLIETRRVCGAIILQKYQVNREDFYKYFGIPASPQWTRHVQGGHATSKVDTIRREENKSDNKNVLNLTKLSTSGKPEISEAFLKEYKGLPPKGNPDYTEMVSYLLKKHNVHRSILEVI